MENTTKILSICKENRLISTFLLVMIAMQVPNICHLDCIKRRRRTRVEQGDSGRTGTARHEQARFRNGNRCISKDGDRLREQPRKHEGGNNLESLSPLQLHGGLFARDGSQGGVMQWTKARGR